MNTEADLPLNGSAPARPAHPAPLSGADAAGGPPLEDPTPLAVAVREIELHASSLGWDRPARLYALVQTADLLRREPALAASLGLDAGGDPDALTPVEQDELPTGELEQVLETITWPAAVAGCAAVVERVVLPPGADDAIPDDPAEAAAYAAAHPERQELRLVAAATRDGATYCAYRFRSHDDDRLVVTGTDLVPELLELVTATLADPDLADPDLADPDEEGTP